jgi:hypothetical protein
LTSALHTWPGQASSGLYSFLLEADGTRSTEDARRPGTKRGGGSHNRLLTQCALWNAVVRPVRNDFVRILVFSRVSKKTETGQVPERSAFSWSIYRTGVSVFW